MRIVPKPRVFNANKAIVLPMFAGHTAMAIFTLLLHPPLPLELNQRKIWLAGVNYNSTPNPWHGTSQCYCCLSQTNSKCL